MSGKGGPTPAVRASVIDSLRRLVDEATRVGEWVVVVCPDGSDFLSAFSAGAGGVLPSGASLAGRTAVLPGGGRLSVVPASDEPFVPVGTAFAVAFLGWGDDVAADNRRMLVWRQRASRVVR